MDAGVPRTNDPSRSCEWDFGLASIQLAYARRVSWRGSNRARPVIVLAAALLVACAGSEGPRPPSPTIEAVGLIVEERIYFDRVVYRLESGQTWEGNSGTFRTVMDWGAELLVAGIDADGRWVATLGHQGGLPDDCYFTPEPGTEWGDGIAIGGVLWKKATQFSAQSVPDVGRDYPGGTRFCLDESGQVTSIIPP